MKRDEQKLNYSSSRFANIKIIWQDWIILCLLIALMSAVFFIAYYKFNYKYVRLTIIHNDVLSGQILPETIIDDKNPLEQGYEGGMSYMASQIKAIREKNNNKDIESYDLLLDTGNTFFGGGVNKNEIINNGSMVVNLMNQLKFNASVIGSTEFDYGVQTLKDLSQKANFPFLGANVVYKNKKEIPEFLKPYTIINYPSVRVGIIGLINPNILKLSYPGLMDEIEFMPIMEVTKHYIQELKNKRVNFIIIMSSIWNTAEEIALATRYDNDINLIVSSSKYGDQFEKPLYVGSIPIIKISRSAKYLGAMEFIIESSKNKIVSNEWKLYPINSKHLIPDDKISSIISSNMHILQKEYLGRTLGHSLVDMGYEIAKEGVFGNFVCDMVLKETNADVVFINSGTLKGINKGPITIGKLAKSIPYTNYIYTAKMKGSTIVNLLAHSFDNSRSVGILQIAGLRLKYDLSAPVGRKVFDVKISGNDIDLDKYYNIATIEFLINGGDGHHLFKKAEEVKNHNVTLNKLVFEYIKNNDTVVAFHDGRMENIAEIKNEEHEVTTRDIASKKILSPNKKQGQL
ncbi:MAG: bifunctional metallophosphatase/5'-nucleotidase [Oligoflexia bacterium]|nr:bifunctional metallophosphatase/5'-nucleotidase [Oligoflexia bacterium]